MPVKGALSTSHPERAGAVSVNYISATWTAGSSVFANERRRAALRVRGCASSAKIPLRGTLVGSRSAFIPSGRALCVLSKEWERDAPVLRQHTKSGLIGDSRGGRRPDPAAAQCPPIPFECLGFAPVGCLLASTCTAKRFANGGYGCLNTGMCRYRERQWLCWATVLWGHFRKPRGACSRIPFALSP